ncbi:alcohol dehydrogenase-like 4 [Cannabis sativa]|uniref:alcohol dehydrogenase-like 4 n=1 Tax=Cannabis sativa TaxID=3483 RepID=UPI0029C9E66A|nr:alcohol dehydrogenase-like 4 [Cannabis sativa]
MITIYIDTNTIYMIPTLERRIHLVCYIYIYNHIERPHKTQHNLVKLDQRELKPMENGNHHHQPINGNGNGYCVNKHLIKTKGELITCKAAVVHGPGEPFVLEEILVEPPQKMEVRIKILFTSICHTDLSAWKGENESQRAFPRILGHEASGVVESVGEGVSDFEKGDHVVPIFNGECGDCECCSNHLSSNKCSKFGVDPNMKVMVGDGRSRFWSKDGTKQIYHFLNTSTFAEYSVLNSACLVKIDSKFSPHLKKMTLLSCGVSTGVGAAWNTANVQPGSTVAIFGLGAVGLAVAEGARARGASKIIGVDINPTKFSTGKAMGVTDFINPTELEKPVHQRIREMSKGGVDYSFECAGNVDVLREAFLSTHEGWGLTVILGIHPSTKMLPIHPMELFDGRSITASVFGGFKGKTQLPIFAQQCMEGVVELDKFITHELPFEKINDAFQLLIQGKSLRCILNLS